MTTRFGAAGGNNQPPALAPRYRVPSVLDTFQYSKRSKTTVTTLIGGEQIFGAIADILGKTQSFVAADLYSLQNPALYPERTSPPGTPGANIQAGIIDKLVALQKQGHAVKIVLDNHWESNNQEAQNERTIHHLKQNGVDVVTYPNISEINHVKALIVDNRYAVVGGMNWGNHSPTNHDAALLIEGPDVRNIYAEIFKEGWLSSGRKASEIPTVRPFEQGQIKVLKTASRHAVGGARDDIYVEILKQIGQAQDSIYAQLFVLTQQDIVDNLIFAHKRLTKAGKEGVKILVDPGLFFAFPNTRAGVQKLAKAGVPIRFFATDRTIEEKLHSKWAVFDAKTLLVGSANWSNTGLLSDRENPPGTPKSDPNRRRLSKSNREAVLLLTSPKLGQAFVEQMRYDWKAASFPMLEWRDGKWRPIQSAAIARQSKKAAFGARLNQLA